MDISSTTGGACFFMPVDCSQDTEGLLSTVFLCPFLGITLVNNFIRIGVMCNEKYRMLS